VLVALAALVVAGLAALLIPRAVRDGEPSAAVVPSSPATGSAAAATSPGTSPGSGNTDPSTGAAASRAPGRSSGAATPAPAATGTLTGAALAAPAGFTRYTDPQDRFSVIVPAGWRPVRLDTRVDFRDPGSGRFLRIDTSGTPKPDPYTNWVTYEQQFRQGKVGYRNLGIRRVPGYRPSEGWSTADWEFVLGGTHVLNRNIRVSSARAHAIYWSTPESMWSSAQSRRIFGLAAAGFVPAPVGG
jgi:hypothetical protein